MTIQKKNQKTSCKNNPVPETVYCFEPGIARREGAGSRFVEDMSVTLRAHMGDNQPAVCFQQNQREEIRDMGDCAGALTAESGMHNTNYVCYKTADMQKETYAIDSHPSDSRIEIAGDICPTITYKIAKASSDGPLVMIKNHVSVYSMSSRQMSMMIAEDMSNTIVSTDYKDPQLVCYEVADDE